MAERLGGLLRPTRMRMRVLGVLLVLPMLLAGCGDAGGDDAGSTPSPSTTACRGDGSPVPLTKADLDGDGALDDVYFTPASGSCPAGLGSSVKGLARAPVLTWDASGAADGAAAVRVPGRTGDLVLLLERHPRGGFQTHLYGYSDGSLAELEASGQPLFPFIATDVLTDPITARCVDGGFEVLHARRHEPIGVVPAWDVDRTTYQVDGNDVTNGATTEVADNVLEKDFQKEYADLVEYKLFENCRVQPA